VSVVVAFELCGGCPEKPFKRRVETRSASPSTHSSNRSTAPLPARSDGDEHLYSGFAGGQEKIPAIPAALGCGPQVCQAALNAGTEELRAGVDNRRSNSRFLKAPPS
jgi:hypothetical protein